MPLTKSVLEGNRLSLSRLLTQVENDSPEGRSALVELFPHTGKAHLIGVTGAPGTGKSSLVNQLTLYYRKEQNKRVAIIAVDPSSPFTGGAVLGDRVRMRDLSGDEGVFIREWNRALERLQDMDKASARLIHPVIVDDTAEGAVTFSGFGGFHYTRATGGEPQEDFIKTLTTIVRERRLRAAAQ